MVNVLGFGTQNTQMSDTNQAKWLKVCFLAALNHHTLAPLIQLQVVPLVLLLVKLQSDAYQCISRSLCMFLGLTITRNRRQSAISFKGKIMGGLTPHAEDQKIEENESGVARDQGQEYSSR